ncbi:MAG: hypothetical protein JJ975_13390 [Bacteroidia bacterium]|nr:hypothetical protein [Bacteroidia bacterium]
MKIRLLGLVSICCMALVGCTSKTSTPKHQTKHEHLEKEVDRSGPEYTSKYICPMHCEGSGSDTTGTCPVCEMDYVLNE